MQNILVVGQLPPPVHGQAIMIEKLLHASMPEVRLYHVSMAFSRRIDDVGRFGFGKIAHLFGVVGRIIWNRIRHSTTVLYYPPAGPNRVPMYRDWVILLATRWLFKRVVFHFHAGGLTELLPKLGRPAKVLFRLAYNRPDCAIQLATIAPPDGKTLNATRNVIVPNGIEDAYPQYAGLRQERRNPSPRILFVGALRESKGVADLLGACRLLKARGTPFQLDLMGDFQSPEFESYVRHFISTHQMQTQVNLMGVRRDQAKWRAYAQADIFCFPSFYESENLPVVIIEAMQFELPVIATRWRGIPALVEDGQNGLLVPAHSPPELAQRLEQLVADAELRQTIGRRGREMFLRDFTLEQWTHRMQQVFLDLNGCAQIGAPE